MQIEINIFYAQVPIDKRNVKLQVPDDSSLKTVLNIYFREYSIEITEQEVQALVFFVNNQSSPPDRILKNNDRVTVLNPVFGG